jgi:hypothetical protein
MGVNWNAGMIRWQPYTSDTGQAYPLFHLHPFRYGLVLSSGTEAEIRVGFALHCFTRACDADDVESQYYSDDRETRTFCPDRYALSFRLPDIARNLATSKCGFAKDDNFVTINVDSEGGVSRSYGVFFNVLRVKDVDGVAILLTIQSAYELRPGKQVPVRGSIKFTRLVELTLEGVKPKPAQR